MQLAIFDFDGTISDRDSFLEFIRFAVGPTRFLSGFFWLAPMLVLYFLRIVPNYRAKEMVIAHFFKGWETEKCNRLAREFSAKELPKIIRPAAIERIRWHKQQGHTVAVASASIEFYLKFWCKQEGLDLIATRLEEKKGRLTGKLAGANCHGPEKITRLKAAYDLSKFEKIYGYGDSPADRALQIITGEFHYKPFR